MLVNPSKNLSNYKNLIKSNRLLTLVLKLLLGRRRKRRPKLSLVVLYLIFVPIKESVAGLMPVCTRAHKKPTKAISKVLSCPLFDLESCTVWNEILTKKILFPFKK